MVRFVVGGVTGDEGRVNEAREVRMGREESRFDGG